MSSTENNKSGIHNLEAWEIFSIIACVVILMIVISSDVACGCLSNHYPLFFSSIIGICTGLITAIAILYFQRTHRAEKLFKHYSQIEGEYIRTDIGQDNTAEANLIKMRKQNVGLKIQITYIGENSFTYDMELWKDSEAKAKGIMEFNENNKMIASGNYKYYEGGDRFKDHFGTLTAYWFEDDKSRLYVVHQHVYPRHIEINNPDANRGWQIWEKVQ